MIKQPVQIEVAEYISLLKQVQSQGLFKRTYWYYGILASVSIFVVVLSLYTITLTDSILIQVINALFFSFFSVQIGMIGHDLSHKAVFKSSFLNRFFASIAWSLFGGLSEIRWYEKHNRHHQHPNHIGHDPDVGIPFMFTKKQVDAKSNFLRKHVLPRQHILFWISFAFVYPWNIILGIRSYFENSSWNVIMEINFAIAHYIVLLYLSFIFLPFLTALIFLITHFVAIGLYMGLVFAPNHKGKDEIREDEAFYWTHQIILTRNLHPSWTTFYLFGGLNFQIEHHLFPSMSRLKYWKARIIVKKFCEEKGIRYHQTSFLGSLIEMHNALSRESKRVSH